MPSQDLQTDTNQCTALHQIFSEKIVLPESPRYQIAQSNYWAVQQAELTPSCRFLPADARDVATGIKYLTATNTSFAIASGGHSSVVGASNIDTGITVDLSSLSDVEFVDNDTAVWLGVGARWTDVYTALEHHGLVVSGGRVANVGVGGYVLGGGFSWFANQYGWTCDSVLEFEVITPAGELLHASEDENEYLFWALKGSLGAFGVVTRIKVPTIRNRVVYGGALSYNQAQMPALFAALEKLSDGASSDLQMQGYISFGWSEKYHALGTTAYLVNTDGNQSSAASSAFKSILHCGNSLRKMTLRESAEEIGQSNPLGLRRSKFTLTTKCNTAVMQLMHQLCLEAIEEIRFDDESMMGATLQPLTVPHLQAQSNIFNLSSDDGPLLLVSVELWWSNADRDAYFEHNLRDLYDGLVAALRQADALHPFIYPNYAARWQDPFTALKVVTRKRLEQVRQRYDPEDTWARLVPGLWHV